MHAITGVLKRGRVVLDNPSKLPDGTRVKVHPVPDREGFMRDEDWPTTSEGIEELIPKMELLTPVDETRITAARAATRKVTLAAVRKKMGLDP